jgi:cytochrome c oxidase assembly factor CtaG
MTLRHFLWITWGWDPSVVLGCAALLGAYLAAVRFRLSRGAGSFGAGILVLLLALVGPIDTLSDTYLFSVHMLQHVLLVLAVPPLLLLGLPPALARKALAQPALRGIEGVLGRPALAWLLGMGTLWAWHLPTLYTAALESKNIHIAEHLCFLTTATIFWWPVLTPLPERRLAPLGAVLYLLPASMASSLLGILFVFAPRIVYPFYLHPDDPLGLLPLLRGTWGLTPAVDQVLGGLIMWVPGCLVYLGFAIVPLFRWLSEAEGTPRVQGKRHA